MRLAGGVPGTGHSVLCAGASEATRWVWDEHGEAEVPEEAALIVLALSGRSGLRQADTEPAPDLPDDEALDLHPLGHYTFEAPPAPASDEANTPVKATPKKRSAPRKRR